MARRAIIVDEIADVSGCRWDIRAYRATEHGFAIAFGWPSDQPRGPGGGGPWVVSQFEIVRALAPLASTSPSHHIKIARTRLGRHVKARIAVYT